MSWCYIIQKLKSTGWCTTESGNIAKNGEGEVTGGGKGEHSSGAERVNRSIRVEGDNILVPYETVQKGINLQHCFEASMVVISVNLKPMDPTLALPYLVRTVTHNKSDWGGPVPES